MNGVNILKITKEMWLEINCGYKHVDVRKLNKDYIQIGNEIIFVDVNTYRLYGSKRCIGKVYHNPNNIGYAIKHKKTIDYVYNNYINEQLVILFTLGD